MAIAVLDRNRKGKETSEDTTWPSNGTATMALDAVASWQFSPWCFFRSRLVLCGQGKPEFYRFRDHTVRMGMGIPWATKS